MCGGVEPEEEHPETENSCSPARQRLFLARAGKLSAAAQRPLFATPVFAWHAHGAWHACAESEYWQAHGISTEMRLTGVMRTHSCATLILLGMVIARAAAVEASRQRALFSRERGTCTRTWLLGVPLLQC